MTLLTGILHREGSHPELLAAPEGGQAQRKKIKKKIKKREGEPS
jgi:gas vesicle protein